MYDGCSPSPSSDPHHLPNNTAWVHGYAPLAPRMYTPPAFRSYIFFGDIRNKSQKDLDDLMGEPPGFSTHACDVYSPIGLIGLILMKLE